MKYNLAFVTYFVFIFIFFITYYEYALNVNAQNGSSMDDSTFRNTTEFKETNPSIITPWNTGNHHDNGRASNN